MNAISQLTQTTVRFFVALLVLATFIGQTAAAETVSKISLSAKLTGGENVGSYVTLTCTSGRTGMTGTGALLGYNTRTKTSYNYPFTITKITTSTGSVVCTGNLTSGPAVTLTVKPTTGAITFSYKLANGTTVNSTGQGVFTSR